MDREILIRYMRCETTSEEERAVLDWLDESPENRREMDRLDEVFNAMVLHAPAPSHVAERRLRFSLRRIGRSAVAIAASLALVLGGAYLFGSRRIDRFSRQMLSVSAPEGQRVHVTLQDGTQVWLNGGSTIAYPVAFVRGERRVKISGEAMFDVAHLDDRLFVVETYAGSVEVLGTQFDVLADREHGVFSTALLRGKVRIRNAAVPSEELLLTEGQRADLQNGRLVARAIEYHDDYLWADGIIALNSASFSHLISKIERAYNVRVELQRAEPPVIRFRGKIRIVEGLEHTLRMLLTDTDTVFEIDYETNRVFIR